MRTRLTLAGACLIAAACIAAAQQPPSPPPPLVKENAAVKVSEHVYVISDDGVPAVPNVGIIVGGRATLVVDTGLGTRNGETILREVRKVSRHDELYVVSTHFHPEHTLGEGAFPATAKILRSNLQQKDIDEFGLTSLRNFAGRTPVMAELLKDVGFRKADELFDTEKLLDLGGVGVRIFWLGPAHTRGDTLVFIEPDRVLFAGDVVMNRRFLSFSSPYSSLRAWMNSLDQLQPIRPGLIVPSHGEMADASLIERNRNYLKALQTRTAELKRQGMSLEETTKILGPEFQSSNPDWTNAGNTAAAIRIAYTEAE